jgi:hypothetical protein
VRAAPAHLRAQALKVAFPAPVNQVCQALQNLHLAQAALPVRAALLRAAYHQAQSLQ